jgi:hypothetical protein
MQYHVVHTSAAAGEATIIDAEDDSKAIALVSTFLSGTELHIWQGQRLVQTLRLGGDANAPATSHSAPEERTPRSRELLLDNFGAMARSK